MLDPNGQQVVMRQDGDPFMNDLVHAHDGEGRCAPLLVVEYAGDGRVNGVLFVGNIPGLPISTAAMVEHDADPMSKSLVHTVGGPKPITWHTREECGWNR